jgi:cell division protein FtsW
LEEQRLHDARIPMLVDTGTPENTSSTFVSDAQTAADPTAKMLNNDEEFE